MFDYGREVCERFTVFGFYWLLLTVGSSVGISFGFLGVRCGC